MTNQLKLKKPLVKCNFDIQKDDTRIQVKFFENRVVFERIQGRDYCYEGTCVYRYETPEKGEEFIKSMCRQVVKSGTSSFVFFSERTILSDRKLAFTINGYEIAKVSEYCSTKKDSLVSYSPIPQEEFFRQLRERLKEVVEEPSLEADRIRYALKDFKPVREYSITTYDESAPFTPEQQAYLARLIEEAIK